MFTSAIFEVNNIAYNKSKYEKVLKSGKSLYKREIDSNFGSERGIYKKVL